MDIYDFISKIINSIAWPLVLVSLLIIFRKPIRELIKRIENAVLPGGTEFKFGKYGDAIIDKTKIEEKPVRKYEYAEIQGKKTTEVKWDRPFNIFWLGHDLMWTVDVLLRDGSKPIILHGLKQSLFHFNGLNLSTELPNARKNLEELIADTERSKSHKWSFDKRDLFASKLMFIIEEIGKVSSTV
jgi:hypothetical protein